jgi:hypothetical protein
MVKMKKIWDEIRNRHALRQFEKELSTDIERFNKDLTEAVNQSLKRKSLRPIRDAATLLVITSAAFEQDTNNNGTVG